jgi:MYXO-CTERM domain-containing protein
MLPKLALVLVLAQYNRSRVNDRDPASQCLWWQEGTTITMRQQVDGNPETPGETEFEAVSRSISSWQAQLAACGSLTLEEGPRTASREVGYFERRPNENIVLFRQRSCSDAAPATASCRDSNSCGNAYDCWQHAPGAIAITTTSYEPGTGRILDSDIEFNTPNFIFTTVDSPPCVSPIFNTGCVATDVQNTATHEFGHVLGLGHIDVAGSTMSARASSGETSKRVIDDGSRQFICDVYPRGQPAKTCVLLKADPVLGETPGCGCTAGDSAGWGLLGLAAVARRRRR